MAASTLGIGALFLRPGRTAADVLGPATPSGLWGAVRTDAGLVALWSSGGRVDVVRLADRGAVAVAEVLGHPDLEVPAGIAAGGSPLVLGATLDVRRGRRSIAVDHLPAQVRAALAEEVDGPMSLADLVLDEVAGPVVEARRLDGQPVALTPPVAHGVLGALLDGPDGWVAVQHAPTVEGDHCSSLTVACGGCAALQVHDLGLAGPVSLVGPAGSPLVSVADGDGRLRAWRLGGRPQPLTSLPDASAVALHVVDDHPVGLRVDAAGASLIAPAGGGWEVVRDVPDTAGANRVLAVAGTEPEFLVELPDRLVLVDGHGTVRR